MIQPVKLFLLSFFILLAVHGYSQTTGADEAIIQRYALPGARNAASGQRLFLARAKQADAGFVEKYGNKVVLQVAKNWFILKADSLPAADFQQLHPAGNAYKLSPAFFSHKPLQEGSDYHFTVKVTDGSLLLQRLARHRLRVLHSYNNRYFIIQAKPSFARDVLVNESYVTAIGVAAAKPVEEMVINDLDRGVNSIDLFFSQYPSTNGEGVTISIKENLPDTNDIDFKGRYQSTPHTSSTVTTHATTMATIAGGAGNTFNSGKGVAWGSRVASSDFANLLPDENYTDYNIAVQNHSYGTQVENFYGPEASAFDENLNNHPQLVHVFSAGNSGILTPADGNYAGIVGFANLTGNFKQAKNVITVGAVDSFFNVASASSKGPAYDGRIKPELVAYGNDGSSGAAAITSGTVAAMQGAYAAMHRGSLPSNALVKAVLINTADDVLEEGPDFFSGYGNVNTYRAVRAITGKQYFSGESLPEATDSFLLHIPPHTNKVKLSLVWTDQPATPNVFTALVNDLDIVLKKVDGGTVYLPWVLQTAADSARLLAPATRARDSLNVVEQVSVQEPAAGDYHVYVKGYRVNGRQPYFVAWEMDAADTFLFANPAATSHFLPGKKAVIRWFGTHKEPQATLEFSLDKGINWQRISDTVQPARNFCTWQVPDTTAIALLRMRIGNKTYVSDTFDICAQPAPVVVLNCADSILLRWPAIPGINRYHVLSLGDTYLEGVAATNDTDIVLKNISSPFFAITPVFDNNRPGLNSYTFNYATQNAGCYINNFLADLTPDGRADLLLSLGTSDGVDSVQFERLQGSTWNYIGAQKPVTMLSFHFFYSDLVNGINNFRAVVWVNGIRVLSNTAAVYYFLQTDFIAKPNPLQRGQLLTILSSGVTPGTLVVFNLAGKKLLEQPVVNTETVLNTKALAPGLYLLVIYDERRQKVFRGKLIIQ